MANDKFDLSKDFYKLWFENKQCTMRDIVHETGILLVKRTDQDNSKTNPTQEWQLIIKKHPLCARDLDF